MNEFLIFRVNYLIVFIAVMLADGMQGTHLYALYSEYNYNVASLYATGFMAGALTSPFIGPLVDKFGRKNSAIAYCLLEVVINTMEQYNCLVGLILSRIIGGITTNLLFTVFESWVLSEHRKKGFAEEDYDVILRDSVIASNVSAIGSGIIAHYLAEHFGSVGPFQGAVWCTALALFLVSCCWDENYGVLVPGDRNIMEILNDGVKIVKSDSRIFRLGVIMGLAEGTLQTFIYLWSPFLLQISLQPNFHSIKATFVDSNNEPQYGLIFGAFMLFGALGGVIQPYIFSFLNKSLYHRIIPARTLQRDTQIVDNEDETSCGSNLMESEVSSDESIGGSPLYVSEELRSTSANIQGGVCFVLCSALLATPIYLGKESSFSSILLAFFCYEFLIGIYLPCEGILRSIYFPKDEICTLMTLLRVIVNVLVAFGVLLTNVVQLKSAFTMCSLSLGLAAMLQFSLVTKGEWLKILRTSALIDKEYRFVPNVLVPMMENDEVDKLPKAKHD